VAHFNFILLLIVGNSTLFGQILSQRERRRSALMCSLRRKGCAEGSGGGRASEWIDRRRAERRTAAAAIFPTGVYLHLALNELFLSLRRARGGPTDAHALLLTPDPDKSFAPRL
jgi:hypothetical protein